MHKSVGEWSAPSVQPLALPITFLGSFKVYDL